MGVYPHPFARHDGDGAVEVVAEVPQVLGRTRAAEAALAVPEQDLAHPVWDHDGVRVRLQRPLAGHVPAVLEHVVPSLDEDARVERSHVDPAERREEVDVYDTDRQPVRQITEHLPCGAVADNEVLVAAEDAEALVELPRE